MHNYSQDGCVLTLTAPYTRLAGEGALVDGVFGVAANDVTSGSSGEFVTEGVIDLAKTNAQAWTQGQKIYWDNTNKRCDSSSSVGPEIGFATEAAANPSTTGKVKLNGIGITRSPSSIIEGTSAPTSISTAGARTITAAELLTGIYVRDPNGASRSDTLPTAALLVAAVPGAKVGDVIRTYVINGADAAEVLTLLVGSGGAFDANQTAASQVVGQNTSKMLHIRLTNVTSGSEAYVAYL
jgi:predicted RecA/RadA family phage recombinase